MSVAQELLARRAEGRLRRRAAIGELMNGGLYPELHRPQPIQEALLDPEKGPKIGAALTKELVVAGSADVRRGLRRKPTGPDLEANSRKTAS